MRRLIGRLAAVRRAVVGFFCELETRQTALRAIVTAIFGIWLIWWNPFDLFHKADEASSNAFQFFATPLMDHAQKDPRIAVVLFTPSGLQNIRNALEVDDGWTWPLSFDEQAQVLDRIVHYKPAYVFYDIEFYQRRGSDARFRRSLEAATQPAKPDGGAWDCTHDRDVKGIRVFLAQPPHPLRIWPQLCAAGTQAVDIVWSGRPNVYPLIHEHEIFDGERKRTLKSPSPAAAIFAAACADNRIVPVENCFGDFAGRKPINLLWRATYDSVVTLKYSGAMLSECKDEPPHGWQKSWLDLSARIRSFFASAASSMAETVVGPCPAAVVIGADTLLLHKSLGQSDALLSAAFKNRAVFIGADMPGLRDRVSSPFHGMVPGVFTHAAAFDNLAERGPHYIKALDEEDFISCNRLGQFAVVAIGLFLTFRVTEHLRERVPRLAAIVHRQPQGPSRRDYLVALMAIFGILAIALLIAAVLGLISSVLFFGLDMAPLDWIGEIAIIWLAAFEGTVSVLGMALLVFPLWLPLARRVARKFLKEPEEVFHA